MILRRVFRKLVVRVGTGSIWLRIGTGGGHFECGNDMIYLLTAIGLPPGGSSTVHSYTQTVQQQ
jgi:hypothetical protein